MKPFDSIETSALAPRPFQPRKRRSLWLVVAGLALTTSGLVYAQTSSRLPAPPAMPAPPAPSADAPKPPAPGAPLPGAPLAGAPNADAPRPPADGPAGPKGKGKPKGPKVGPEDGPRPTPPDANTSSGAARSLERAYRAAGEVGETSGDARDVAMAARSFYNRALSAYSSNNYLQAFKLAEGSARLSRTARTLSDASTPGLPSVPGLTPPPVVATTTDSERAARELNRNFDEANRAAAFDNAASNRYRAQSEENYRAALSAYNNKNYEEAADRARLGAEQAKAAREYAETLAL